MHRSERFPSGQDFAASCRLVKCRKASGGKRVGPSGKQMGHAHLTWAVSEAAPLFLRNNLQGQQLLARLEQKQDQGKALSILAHTLGRAVSCMRKRQGAFDMGMFLQTSGRRAGEPGASRAIKGMRLNRARALSDLTASVNATACLGRLSLNPGDCLDLRSGS
jgi:hypothetical protein